MKKLHVAFSSAAAGIIMLCASAVPSNAITINFGNNATPPVAPLGTNTLEDYNFASGSPVIQNWFFAIDHTLTGPVDVFANASSTNSSLGIKPIIIHSGRLSVRQVKLTQPISCLQPLRRRGAVVQAW